MVEVVAIVEGPTEQTFIRDVLAGHLSLLGIAIWARLSGKTGKRGGVQKWETARDDIVRTLKEGRYCTTMFDFYGMSQDWPGRSEAEGLSWRERSAHVEARILADVSGQFDASFNPAQFIPYVQLHEFEALVFAGPAILAEAAAAASGCKEKQLVVRFQAIVDEAGDPEAIDGGFDTCPSRRITKVAPGYRKAALGPIVTQRIGLPALRTKCEHFADWLLRLEQLGAAVSSTAVSKQKHKKD